MAKKAKKKNAMRGKRYDAAFKTKAIALVKDTGMPVSRAADKLGVTAVTLGAWVKGAGVKPAGKRRGRKPGRKPVRRTTTPAVAVTAPRAVVTTNVAQLQHELEKSRLEVDILKEALIMFAKRS